MDGIFVSTASAFGSVLNGIIWSAGMDVPTGGVKSVANPTKRPIAKKAK